MRVNVGDFVLLEYKTFEGEIAKGIFYVIYHECKDIASSTAFSAVKVSSHASGYQIPISSYVFPFLKHDSFINCSSMHRFMEDEVLDIIGRGNNYCLTKVRIQLKSYFLSIRDQLDDRISGGTYV